MSGSVARKTLKLHLASLLLLSLILALAMDGLGRVASAEPDDIPDHVVISELYPNPETSATGEFVELYNPTESDIDLTGWKLKDDDGKSCTFGGTIPRHGFYLIVYDNTEYKKDNASWPDANEEILPYYFLANDGDELRLKNPAGDIIDTVGYGGAAEWYETSPAPLPSKGKSIERKALFEGYAPCQDTDDNSVDFFLQTSPNPQNSGAPPMEPSPPATPTPTPTETPTPTPPPVPVGGVVVPASKLELLAPWIGLAALACVILASGAAAIKTITNDQ